MKNARIRTLIVESSTFVRTLLRTAMSGHQEIEVIGFAGDEDQARELIRSSSPEVVVIDIEFVRSDGGGPLQDLVGSVPAGFVVVSNLSREGAEAALEAMDKGVFDCVVKPRKTGLAGVPRFREVLCDRVIGAARARHLGGAVTPPAPRRPVSSPVDIEPGWVAAMGIGCGGPQILMRILPAFPKEFPAILVAQHMPGCFTQVLAERLGRVCEMTVREAVQDERVEPGTILIAPGGLHMEVTRHGHELIVQLDSGPRVWGHRPSIDMLFNAVARDCGSRAVGVLMTGTGRDGISGLIAMRRAGGWTIAQTEKSGSGGDGLDPSVRAEAVEPWADLDGIPAAIAEAMRAGSPEPALTA
jgi:two-component system, chemotaxis family, protein-glutamate methylesterase/glutaminase